MHQGNDILYPQWQQVLDDSFLTKSREQDRKQLYQLDNVIIYL